MHRAHKLIKIFQVCKVILSYRQHVSLNNHKLKLIKTRYPSDVYYIQFSNMFTYIDKEKRVDYKCSTEKKRAYFLDSLLFYVKITFFLTLSEVLNKMIPIVEKKYLLDLRGSLATSSATDWTVFSWVLIFVRPEWLMTWRSGSVIQAVPERVQPLVLSITRKPLVQMLRDYTKT